MATSTLGRSQVRAEPGDGPAGAEREGSSSLAVARSQRLVAVASTQAVVAARRSAAETARARRAFGLVALIGMVGLCCFGATVWPDLVPYEWFPALRLAGFGLGAAPVLLLLVVATRDGGEPRIASAGAAARAQAVADLVQRLDTALRAAERIEGLGTSHLRLAETLIEAAERDAERVSREERKRRGSRLQRRHDRIVPRHLRVVVRTADGRQLAGRIADVSISGAALAERLPRVEIGDEVMLGQHPAVATRLWATGIAFAFKAELDPSTFDESLVL